MDFIILGFKITDISENKDLYSKFINQLADNQWGRTRAAPGSTRREERLAPDPILPDARKIRIMIHVNGRYKECGVKDVSKNGFSISIKNPDIIASLDLRVGEEFVFGVLIRNHKFICKAELRHTTHNKHVRVS